MNPFSGQGDVTALFISPAFDDPSAERVESQFQRSTNSESRRKREIPLPSVTTFNGHHGGHRSFSEGVAVGHVETIREVDRLGEPLGAAVD